MHPGHLLLAMSAPLAGMSSAPRCLAADGPINSGLVFSQPGDDGQHLLMAIKLNLLCMPALVWLPLFCSKMGQIATSGMI